MYVLRTYSMLPCRYLVTYRPDQKKAHVLLKEGASSQDCLRASFAAHLMLYLMDGLPVSNQLPNCQHVGPLVVPPGATWPAVLAKTTK